MTPADDQIIAKPQVISTGLKSKQDIQIYIAKRGDTISNVANKFDVTADTIRLSNNLSQEEIASGTKLYISPVNGIVYRVKPGDTPESLSARYRTNKAQLIAFNDAELTGKFKTGELIVIPNAVDTQSLSSQSGSSTGYSFSYGNFQAAYGSNGYDFGYCTYWVALRRAQVGMPIPSNLGNAVTWKPLAERAGYQTGSVPRKYAIIWDPSIGGVYGHVGFVEKVNSDGSVYISDMNIKGWNIVSQRTLSPSQAANYQYIY